MNIDDFVYSLKKYKSYTDNLVSEQVLPPQEATWVEIPSVLDKAVIEVLHKTGIKKLYLHQEQAIIQVLQGRHIVISTGVASGKSLTYQIPVMQTLCTNPYAVTLLMYPTKALAQDQHQKFENMLKHLAAAQQKKSSYQAGIYDGDTPSALRQRLRKQANLLFSNPDMLHLGILPHHTMWTAFFSNLKYVIIDEVHMYRGVFGSHLANVIRRLKRIAAFYGSRPQFIFTSATLSNAKEFIETLLNEEVKLINSDTSPHGRRYFHIINPPMVNYDLGIRKSSLIESVYLAGQFLRTNAQALLFTITRRSAELLYIYLCSKTDKPDRIKSYRSGYLPEQRREIERKLREREIELVITTNALELGIDIGGLDAVFLNGYPGSICSTRQQAGRAGRKGESSLAILIASSTAIDQYICSHPEYLWDKAPEQALIDPNNHEILKSHLLCSIFEMAWLDSEKFGDRQYLQLEKCLNELLQEGKIRKVGNRYRALPETYPAAEVSLRNAPGQYLISYKDELIGVVDEASAFWMTHDNAIYLQNGETWLVNKLDIEKKQVEVELIRTNYYTQATRTTEIEKISHTSNRTAKGCYHNIGKIRVTTQITGYKKLRWYTQEVIGYGELDLPPTSMDTDGWWLEIYPNVVKRVKEMGLWRNAVNDYGKGWNALKQTIRKRDQYRCQHCGLNESEKPFDVHHIIPLRRFDNAEQANDPANLVTLCARCHRLAEQQVHIQSGLAALAYLLGNLAPFFLMCAEKDLGIHSEDNSPLGEGNPVVIIYDNVPGGIGLSRKLYDLSNKLLKEALALINNCPCKDGCPACTGPVAENGLGAKEHAKAILTELVETDPPSAQIIDFPLKS